MRVKEYLEHFNNYIDISFLKAVARKDENTPFYHAEYVSTPMRTAAEWKVSTLTDYIILNDRQAAITWLSGSDWNIMIKNGRAKNLLIISEDDLKTLYPSESQRYDMEKYIEAQILF